MQQLNVLPAAAACPLNAADKCLHMLISSQQAFRSAAPHQLLIIAAVHAAASSALYGKERMPESAEKNVSRVVAVLLIFVCVQSRCTPVLLCGYAQACRSLVPRLSAPWSHMLQPVPCSCIQYVLLVLVLLVPECGSRQDFSYAWLRGFNCWLQLVVCSPKLVLSG